MTVENTLRRVHDDIAVGDLGMARIRLGSLLVAHPDSQKVRLEMLRVCRLAGDPSAAGRYGFLTDLVEQHEIDAFAHRHGGRATLMLRAVGYDAVSLDILPQQARDRLLELEGQAANDPAGVGAVALHEENETWVDAVVTAGCLLAALILATLLVLGVVQAFQLVSGWL